MRKFANFEDQLKQIRMSEQQQNTKKSQQSYADRNVFQIDDEEEEETEIEVSMYRIQKQMPNISNA